MPRFPVPEILRTPLESLFLQVKAMNEDTDVKAFLRPAEILHRGMLCLFVMH
jgi:ATP-dependent RNA helicase DHX57